MHGAAVSRSQPMAQFSEIGSGLRPDNGPEVEDTVLFSSVSANYFDTLSIPLVSGRFFDSGDARDRPKVAIVNQTLARLFFPGLNPVGRRIGADTTIVGVVADIRHRSLDDKVWPEMFLPFAQSPSPWITVFVRGAGLRMATAGMVIGLTGALLVTRVLQTFLYGITPTDPTTLCLVCGAVTIAVFGAAYLPARRAAIVDPMTALRVE